jgi:type I restriction enzyme, S subunit
VLPDGWELASVDQITNNHDGRRVPVKRSDRDNMEGEYPYYGASGVIDHVDDYLFDGEYLLIAEDGANLLTRSTPIAFRASGKFWVNNHAHIVQTYAEIPLQYLEFFFESINLKFFVTGSAQPKLTQTNLNRISVPLPPSTNSTASLKRSKKCSRSWTRASGHWSKPKLCSRATAARC